MSKVLLKYGERRIGFRVEDLTMAKIASAFGLAGQIHVEDVTGTATFADADGSFSDSSWQEGEVLEVRGHRLEDSANNTGLSLWAASQTAPGNLQGWPRTGLRSGYVPFRSSSDRWQAAQSSTESSTSTKAHLQSFTSRATSTPTALTGKRKGLVKPVGIVMLTDDGRVGDALDETFIKVTPGETTVTSILATVNSRFKDEYGELALVSSSGNQLTDTTETSMAEFWTGNRKVFATPKALLDQKKERRRSSRSGSLRYRRQMGKQTSSSTTYIASSDEDDDLPPFHCSAPAKVKCSMTTDRAAPRTTASISSEDLQAVMSGVQDVMTCFKTDMIAEIKTAFSKGSQLEELERDRKRTSALQELVACALCRDTLCHAPSVSVPAGCCGKLACTVCLEQSWADQENRDGTGFPRCPLCGLDGIGPDSSVVVKGLDELFNALQ